MMRELVAVGSRSELAAEEAELLLDSEWVDSEFAAIMIASGFGDRVVALATTAAVGPRPGARATRSGSATRPLVTALARRRVASRVRSPPTRRG